MQTYEEVAKKMEQEQIVHVDLREYAVGSPRYERLIEAMALAQRFTWPSTLVYNL
jgi:hypothetical protein